MSIRILTEASGSLVAGYLIRAIQQAGFYAVSSDIDEQCVGRYLANDFIKMPFSTDPGLWDKVEQLLSLHNISAVIPSFDETLYGWAIRKEYFAEKNIQIFISNAETINICQDKWRTYQSFVQYGIPTPKTSLKQEFTLIKPRCGRGGVGIQITNQTVLMEGMISQEYLEGEEYTVDVFCDADSSPIYIVPRKRILVKDGKSTAGVTSYHYELVEWVKLICKSIPFQGAINIQCFINYQNEIKFTEINPRVAGGMALGFAATENWVKLMVDHFIHKKSIIPKAVTYGLKMKRYYSEVFIND